MKKTSSEVVSGYKLIFGYLGLFLVLIGGIILLPLLIIPFLPLLMRNDFAIDFLNNPFGDGSTLLSSMSLFRDAKWWPSFLIPGLFAIGLGLLLFFLLIYKKEKAQLRKHHDSILLSLVWLSAMLFCSLPFFLRNMDWSTFTFEVNQFGFIASLFESTSGLCSIGLSVFKGLGANVPTVPTLHPIWDGYYIYCLYRSILLFVGGVGLVLVVGSALSDRFGINLYQVEGHNDRLLPNLAKSSRMIFSIYVGYIIVGSIAYILSGMSIFDSLNHSISAISTGGFSPRAESIAFYSIHNGQDVGGIYGCNAIAIEIVSIVLMLLGSTNFITHYKLIKFRFSKAFNDSEIKLVAILTVIFMPLLMITVKQMNGGISFGDNLRYTLFHYVSAISTTGLSNSMAAFSYDNSILLFGATGVFLITLLMFIGGGAGSTSGAIKQHRAAICFKSLSWNIKNELSSKNLIIPRQIYRHGELVNIKDDEINETRTIILMYFLTLLTGSILISLLLSKYGVTPAESTFELMSALSSTGFSLQSFSIINSCGNAWPISLTMFILLFAMFLGRLEILQVYIAGNQTVKDIFKRD